MLRLKEWTPFAIVLVVWMAASIAIDTVPVHNQLVRALVMGGGLVAIFLAAGWVRRARAQKQ